MSFIEFKENEKFPDKNADVSDSHESFKDAGYLLQDNEIVIDIDNMDKTAIQKLIEVFHIDTQIVWTTRGIHLYFTHIDKSRNVPKEGLNALGFKVEYKTAKRDKHITIKQNGTLRTIENEGHRKPVPDWLLPNDRYTELHGLDEGDGRNNQLWKHGMVLKSLYEDQFSTMLNFINNSVFDTALPDKELQGVLHSVNQTKVTADKGNESLVATSIIEQFNVVMYKNHLYFKGSNTKRFIQDENRLKGIIYKYCNEEANSRYVDEVFKQMELKLFDRQVKGDNFTVVLKNGVLQDGEFAEITNYQEFTPYYVERNYNPNAEPVQAVEEFLNFFTDGDENFKKLIFEIMGYTLVTDRHFIAGLRKFFIFLGSSGTGKSSLLKILGHILGEENYTNVSLSDISDDRFAYTLKDKLVNLGDDIENKPINQVTMKRLKNIASADSIQLRKLHATAHDIHLTTTLIFTSNHLLKSFDKEDAYKERVIWLPAYRKPDVRDVKLFHKLTTDKAVEYWFKNIVEGYQRLYQNYRFTQSDKLDEFNQYYHDQNNPVLEYVEGAELSVHNFVGCTRTSTYETYVHWCREMMTKPVRRLTFYEGIEQYFDIVEKRTKTNRGWAFPDGDNRVIELEERRKNG